MGLQKLYNFLLLCLYTLKCVLLWDSNCRQDIKKGAL